MIRRDEPTKKKSQNINLELLTQQIGPVTPDDAGGYRSVNILCFKIREFKMKETNSIWKPCLKLIVHGETAQALVNLKYVHHYDHTMYEEEVPLQKKIHLYIETRVEQASLPN